MNFGAFDIETSGLGGKFLIAGCYDGNNYFEYKDLCYLIDYFYMNKNIKFWIAHNGGKYDFRYLIPEIIKLGYKIKPLVINGSMASLKVYKNNKKLFELRDSYFLLPSGLRKLTYEFDVEHKKLEFNDYNSKIVTEEMQEYLRNDVIGLYEVYEKNYQEILASTKCEPSLTFGSTALKVYSTLWKDKFKLIRNIDNKELREGYFGGRCEVFKRYGEDLYYYDFNSLYPSVMKQFEYPIGDYTITKTPKTKLYISKINWVCPKNLEIPVLPMKINNKLMFCTGKGNGVYSSIEITKALQMGYQIEYLKTYNFNQSTNLFEGYVDYFYKIKRKETKNTAKYQMAKLYLNSLYGKFGQHNIRDSYIINPDNDWINKHMEFELCDCSSNYLMFKKEYYHNNLWVNLPIIIFITSHARIKLYEMFEKIGFEHVYYCDTDSIITDIEVNQSLELGEVKLEDVIKKGYFLFPKVYAYMNNEDIVCIKSKGFDVKKLRFEDYVTSYNTDNYNSFNQEKDAIAGFKTTLKRFDKWMQNFKSTKSIKSGYSKRQMIGKINTKPIDL